MIDRSRARMLSRIIPLILVSCFIATQAAATPQHCTAASLTGRYVFTGQGFIEPIEPGVERLHFGFFEFDGHGKLSGKQSSSRGGRIGREELEGTYTLTADCSGTLTFHHVSRPGADTYGPGVDTHWDMYVTTDGRMGHLIRMDQGTMAMRTFKK